MLWLVIGCQHPPIACRRCGLPLLTLDGVWVLGHFLSTQNPKSRLVIMVSAAASILILSVNQAKR